MAPKGLQAFARIWGIHAQSTMPDYAERHDNIALIEDKVKNKFKWSWLEEKDHLGDYFSVYVRKLKVAGLTECIWCNDHLKYASRGKQCLRDHAKTSKLSQIDATTSSGPTSSDVSRNQKGHQRLVTGIISVKMLVLLSDSPIESCKQSENSDDLALICVRQGAIVLVCDPGTRMIQ